jgi:hypothetical protein
MISTSDLILIGLCFLIGFINDSIGPTAYHYDNKIVIVDKNYQCPKKCGVNHNHSVYFEEESSGMVVDKDKLGKKYKEKKKKK